MFLLRIIYDLLITILIAHYIKYYKSYNHMMMMMMIHDA